MMFLCLIAFLATYSGTWLWIRFAGQRVLQDVPGPRSSHSRTTVRGGGVVFISVFLLFAWGLTSSTESVQFTLFEFLAIMMMMVVGLIDDWRGVSALHRLILQFIAAITLVVNAIPFEHQAMMLIVCVVFAAVWLINLYNFMDGIDGIAAIQAITVSLVMAAVLYFQQHLEIAWLLVGLAATVAGFLFWNFPSCRIFMGDSGSASLGTIFVIFILSTAQITSDYVWYWLIMMSVFIVDTSWTLIVRLTTGQKVWTAHNLHAYQILSRRLESHRKVSLLVAGYNILWLAPLVLALLTHTIDTMMAIALAWTPMIILCFYLKAGRLGFQEKIINK